VSFRYRLFNVDHFNIHLLLPGQVDLVRPEFDVVVRRGLGLKRLVANPEAGIFENQFGIQGRRDRRFDGRGAENRPPFVDPAYNLGRYLDTLLVDLQFCNVRRVRPGLCRSGRFGNCDAGSEQQG
jgi:hypothetical protein